MNSAKELIDSISGDEYKNKMSDFLIAIEALTQKEPAVGFNPRFYVPGWIGVIQSIIVSGKKDKWCKLPFYNQKNYYEFTEWVNDMAHDFHDYLNSTDVKSREDYGEHLEEIKNVFQLMLLVWSECAPEVSLDLDSDYYDEKTGKQYKVSMAYLLKKSIEAEVGAPKRASNEVKQKTSTWDNIKEDAKTMGYMLAGWIINLVLLALIIGLFDLIFN